MIFPYALGVRPVKVDGEIVGGGQFFLFIPTNGIFFIYTLKQHPRLYLNPETILSQIILNFIEN